MRDALGALTVRGRAFLAAGVTAVVCALSLGQPGLTRIGVLLLALPLASAALLSRTRYRLSLVRTVAPQVVPAGQPARVELTLANEGRTPSGVLLLEEQLPYALGSRPRFVLEGIRHGWRREVSYPVRSEVRGRFELGPMSVRVADPFGLVEMGRAFQTTVPLTVTPRTVVLPTIPLGGSRSGSGEHLTRSFATGSAEDVTVREYRRGDDLRRVHWRSSARTGELMVRREEQPWQARATVVIDNRARAHRGQGAASSLETAVSAAASIALHLVRRGFSVRLATAGGLEGGGTWHDREAEVGAAPLLEALAVLQPARGAMLDGSWLTDAQHGGLTVAVLGAVDALDTPVLRRMRHHASAGLALVLDVDAWVRRRSSDATAASLLARQGWRTASVAPGDRLDAVWQSLGAGAGDRSAAPAGAAAPVGSAAAAGSAGRELWGTVWESAAPTQEGVR